MQAPLYVNGLPNRVDSLLVFCARCTHSEFIHRDRGTRGCLYSECGCASFGGPVETNLNATAQPRGGVRGRTAPRKRKRVGVPTSPSREG